MNFFCVLQQVECYIPVKLEVFEMIITPDLEYPMICTGVKKGYVFYIKFSSKLDKYVNGILTVFSRYLIVFSVDRILYYLIV